MTTLPRDVAENRRHWDASPIDGLHRGTGVGADGTDVYAIDNFSEQLATAEHLADIYDVERIKWVHGDAEAVAQPDGSFDFAISEYGAAIWCEPRRWLTEAHRLLRPGGNSSFSGATRSQWCVRRRQAMTTSV